MRWFWIDRVTEFESGRRAVAIKNVSLAEEQIHGYAAATEMMPTSLIIEGVAQTGGLLVGEHLGFRARVVLAKVSHAEFFGYATPGDTLAYTAEIVGVRSSGAIVNAKVHVGARLLADLQLVFAHLGDRFAGVELFGPDQLLNILRCYRIYEVGRRADGTPLEVPPHLVDAERAFLNEDQSNSASN